MHKIIYTLALAGLFQGVAAQNLGNWQGLGPIAFPPNISVQINGIGRCTELKFDPTDASILYITSASGGLWKSVNNGASWALLGTDVLTSASCASVCIDFSDPSVLFLGTGDPNYYGSSIGVLKSTDAGTTWQASNSGMGNKMAVELLMLPTDHNTLLAATNGGIYKSTNSGATWIEKQNGGQFTDMIFKPGSNGQTVYACTFDRFYRSTDAGETWNLVAFPNPTAGGTAAGLRLGVSAASPNTVYLAGVFEPGGNNYCAVYKSTNSGGSFTGVYTANALNLTGYNETEGGQGNYNFDITVDPTNANKVYVVSHCVWRSDDGGTNWTRYTDWYEDCHTDMHHIVHSPANNAMLFNANDGGLFVSYDQGDNWAPLSDGIAATEIYHAAQSPIRRDMVSIGTQDNGELYYQQGTDWVTNRGGDWGSRMAFDYASPTTVYYYENNNRRVVTAGEDALNTPITPSNNSRYEFNPLNTNLCFVGDAELYRTTNLNANPPTWTAIGGFTQAITALGSSPANASLLYAIAADNRIYRTTNATAANPTFSNFALPENVDTRAYLAPIKNNQNVVYAAIDRKVYRSADQGATWVDVTGTLPAINTRGLIHDVNSTDESVYWANAKSVFYKNNTLADWVNYSNGLPLIADIQDLMAFNNNTSANVLRVAYYGRGVWESDFYNAATALPYPNFAADTLTGCPGLVVNFTDLSSGNVNAWQWQFPGGSPATSTQQNPTVTYASGGVYPVTLTVTNANGPNSRTETSYIVVTNTQALPLVEGFESGLFPPLGWRLQGTDLSSNWQAEGSVGGYGTSSNCIKFDNYGYDANGERYSFVSSGVDLSQLSAQGGSLTFDVAYAQYSGYRDTLVVYASADCGQTLNQIYLKAGDDLATVPDFNSGAYVPGAADWRTETVDISTFAGSASVQFYFENRGHYGQILYLDNINLFDNTLVSTQNNMPAKPHLAVYPNPSNGRFSLVWRNMPAETLSLKVIDLSGKVLVATDVVDTNPQNGKQEIQLPDAASGLYLLQAKVGDRVWNLKVAVK